MYVLIWLLLRRARVYELLIIVSSFSLVDMCVLWSVVEMSLLSRLVVEKTE